MSSNSNDKPELSNPKSYVSNHGIIEVQYGVENSRVDWKKDLFDYVRDELDKGEMFDPDFCTKNKETGERYWFACIVCPCNLYKDENLVAHVKGQRHQKRAIEKLKSKSNLANQNKRKRDAEIKDFMRSDKRGRSIKVEPESFAEANSRSSGSELINRIKNGPDYPFLGLKYVTEYLNPGNPNKDPMYTCSLEGCKSAWGSASEIYNHLKSSKNKHNKNYLKKYYGIPNLTTDQIFSKCLEVFKEKKEKGKADFYVKQVSSTKEYTELRNRPLDWSEKSAKRSKEKPKSDLTFYKLPSQEKKTQSTFEAFDTLQTKMQLTLEKIQNPMTPEQNVKNLEIQLDQLFRQCDIMFTIFSRNSYLLTETRLEQTKERHDALKAQYKNHLHNLAINLQSNAIAHQFTQDRMVFEEDSFQGIQDNKPEMEMKKPKIDIKLLKTTELGDTSSFSQEIEKALEISGQKLNDQDMKDLFKKKVIEFVQKSVLEKGFDPPKSQIEKIGEKISKAEIERYSFFYKNEPSKYQWSDFQFGDKHKMNITKYIEQKFGK